MKIVNGAAVEETADDLAQRATDEAEYAAELARRATLKAIEAIEAPTGFTRRQREYLLEKSTDAGVKAALRAVEDEIAPERAKLR